MSSNIKPDYSKSYSMVAPFIRNEIMDKINKKEIESNKRTVLWKGKHYPDKEIPTKIYLLGNGTIDELYEKYKNKYGYITKHNFYGYTREMVGQQIMI